MHTFFFPFQPSFLLKINIKFINEPLKCGQLHIRSFIAPNCLVPGLLESKLGKLTILAFVCMYKWCNVEGGGLPALVGPGLTTCTCYRYSLLQKVCLPNLTSPGGKVTKAVRNLLLSGTCCFPHFCVLPSANLSAKQC